jgi:hypothetical protein
LWYGVDPLAEKNFEYSPYVYTGNNPIIYIDPDGGDHIMYLVFEKGNKNATKIGKHAQEIINSNGVNLQVKILYVDQKGFESNYRSKLDKTDGLAYVGSKKFVENILGKTLGQQGLHSERVGYVNEDAVYEKYNNSQEQIAPKEKFVARVAIHEGIGHQFAGTYHTDLNRSDGPEMGERYNGNYMFDQDGNFIPNIMTSGHNTIYDDNRTFNFVSPDLNLINSQIPPKEARIKYKDINFKVCNGINPIDNFSKRLEEQ